MVSFFKRKYAGVFALSFVCPFIAILFCYCVRGIAPFGDGCLMTMDAWGQYFPMLNERLRNFSDWSFSGGLGFNLLTQSAYYTNSPLWALLYFVPQSMRVAAVDLIVALRFGLAGLTFSAWLTNLGKRACAASAKKAYDSGSAKVAVVVFSAAYALSAYGLAFINQFMWMDAVIGLPLVAVGLERLYENEKHTCRPLLYIASLALTLYSNFYIGYTVCVFCVLYFLYMCFREKISWKKRAGLFLNFSFSSLLAGGLTAFTLLPVYSDISQTKAAAMHLQSDEFFKFYHDIPTLLKKFLPFQNVSLAYEAPNVYCGIVCAALVVLYFAYVIVFGCRKSNTDIRRAGVIKYMAIPRKAVIIFFTVIFFMLSFNLSILDYIWHGFHFPNQLPGRQSFLLIFIIVSAAYGIYMKIVKESEKNEKCVNAGKEQIKRNKIFAVLKIAIPVCLISELIGNAVFTVCTQTWVTSSSKYVQYDNALMELNDRVLSDDTLFRAEFIKPSNFNAGQLYGFNGISYYSSLMSENCYDFFKNLGMEVYARNVSTKYIPSNVLNAIFGVKYLISVNSEEETVQGSSADYLVKSGLWEKEFEDEESNVSIYKNRYALPFVFASDKAALNIDVKEYRGINLQRKIFESLCGETVNINDTRAFTAAVDKLRQGGMEEIAFSGSEISGIINVSRDCVLFTSIPYKKGWTVYIDGADSSKICLFDYLLGAEIEKGAHSVRLVYKTPLLKEGLNISGISLVLSAAYIYQKRKREKLSTHIVGGVCCPFVFRTKKR